MLIACVLVLANLDATALPIVIPLRNPASIVEKAVILPPNTCPNKRVQSTSYKNEFAPDTSINGKINKRQVVPCSSFSSSLESTTVSTAIAPSSAC